MRKKIAGLILLFAVFVGTISASYQVMGYEAPITASNKKFVIDIYHGGYHTTIDELQPFIDNLTAAGNQVVILNQTWDFPMDAVALFLPGSKINFTTEEKQTVKNWLMQGGKLLFAGGDSDYGGYFVPTAINDLLAYLNTQIRLDSGAVADADNNDGASYRVGVKDFGTSELAKALTKNMKGGFILHGPCSILGYDGQNYLDLRTHTLQNVDIIAKYSNVSQALDQDVSDTPLDLYANSSEIGNYPAVVYEKLTTLNSSNLILAGESLFTHYKKMYDQVTETGVFQNGTTYGQMFINNIINYFFGSEKTKGVAFEFVIPFAFISLLYTIAIRRKKK